MKIEPEQLIKIEDVVSVADHQDLVQLSESSTQIIRESRQRLVSIQNRGEPVYGINTGYGIFANKSINQADIQHLNRKLILSHAVGIGDPLPDRVVRAAMFIRINTLSKGYSGVRPELIQTIIDMLNKGVTPVIPSKGSLGSSGDLCQLSHMALVITRDEKDDDQESGFARFENQMLSGKQAMAKAGIPRIVLSTKEGLALNNGATFSTALAALAIFEARYLLQVSEIATALSMEALCARSGAMDSRLHKARGQVGQIEVARELSDLVKGSSFIDSVDKVQDAYSIRCAPQVLGAVRDTIQYVESVINRELNAATDNPLIFEPEVAISGGNFHGEPIGLVMDFLSIALCELGAISERRTFRLTDEKTNHGLPPMLVDDPQHAGLNSGLMMPQYTAASLVLENQTLATPSSIRSLPTSAGQEDHNANSMTAARHAYEILENLRQILAIEVYTANRAIELRKRMSTGITGKGTTEIISKLEKIVPFISEDTLWGDEIKKVYRLILDHNL